MTTIRYVNTDLDLVAAFDLEPLALALDARGVWPLSVTRGQDGLWYALFQARNSYGVSETTIAAMLDAVESLSDNDRDSWTRCNLREFVIGYDCVVEPCAYTDRFSSHTLARIAATGASLRIGLHSRSQREHCPTDCPEPDARPAVL